MSRIKKKSYVSVEHRLVSLPTYKTYHGAAIRSCEMIYIQLMCNCDKKYIVFTYSKLSQGGLLYAMIIL